MKKSILLLSSILFCFAVISCSNGSSNDSKSSKDSKKTDVSIKELIEKMPMSIEEYEKQSKGRTARTAEVVDFENEDGVKTLGFDRISEEFSYLRIFMTILKNDLINCDELDFDKNIDISSVKIKSTATKDYFNKNLGPGSEEYFNNLGTINISLKDNVVSVYWSLGVTSGDNSQTPMIMSLYIQGSWSNESYDDFFCGLKYKINSEGVQDWFELESYKTEGTKIIQEISSIRADGPYSKMITEKQGTDWVQYNLGGTEVALNPASDLLAALQSARSIRYKDSTGAAEFMYGNGKRVPDFYLYDIYDLDGYLVFEEEKRNDGNINDTNFRQYIPLKYLRSSKDVVKNDGKYYFADDADFSEPLSIEEVEIEVGHGEENHKKYPCYAMQSVSPSEIKVEDPFSFTKQEYTQSAISKLNDYADKSYSNEFLNKLVPQKEINSIKEKIETWLAKV